MKKMCLRTGLFIITLLLPIIGEAQQQPDANVNLALSADATLSGSVPVGTGRGTPLDLLYDPSVGNYASVTQFNEYGVAVDEDLGTPTVGNGLNWQVDWTTAKQINYITFGGTYPNQPQPNTAWRISYRNNSVWTIIEEGIGGWIDSGIYVWDITDQQPITADAIKVELYSDGVNNLISIHLRGRGGDSGFGDDSATLPKATLIQLLPFNAENCACWGINNIGDIFYENNNVGIGTTTPNEELEVVGTIKSEKLVVDLPTDGIVAQFGNSIPANPGRRNFDFVSYQSSSSPFLEFTMFDNNYNGRFSIMTRANDEFMVLKDNQGSEVFKVARDNINSLGSYIHLPKPDSRIVVGDFAGYLIDDGHKLVVKDGSAMIEGNILTRNKIGVGVNSAEIPNDYHLAVKGRIIGEEVKVQLIADWPDYVFSKGYQLLSLQELENYINLKGHLPNIPSAQDIKKNGVLLGDMNSKLLEKIEELTLYTIQQQKEIEKQTAKNKELEERLAKLEKLINKSN